MSDGHLIIADGGLDMLDFEPEPDLGDTVYLVYGCEIYEVKVYAKGEGFFIPEGYGGWKTELREIRFDKYGENWFYELDKAKERLLDRLEDEWELVEGDGKWWYAARI